MTGQRKLMRLLIYMFSIVAQQLLVSYGVWSCMTLDRNTSVTLRDTAAGEKSNRLYDAK